MGNTKETGLEAELERLAEKLPARVAGFVRWVRRPHSALVRYPLAILLLLGGILISLPLLGIWMIPLALVLIAQDVPALQGPIARLLAWVNRRIQRP